jgi:DNA-binding transcriptional ArsR family regulator
MSKSIKKKPLPKGFMRNMPPAPRSREQEIKSGKISENFTIWDTDILQSKMEELKKNNYIKNEYDYEDEREGECGERSSVLSDKKKMGDDVFTKRRGFFSKKEIVDKEELLSILNYLRNEFFRLQKNKKLKLKGSTTHLFMYLTKYMEDNVISSIEMSLRDMSEMTGLNKNTILISLKKLEDSGLIIKDKVRNRTFIRLNI